VRFQEQAQRTDSDSSLLVSGSTLDERYRIDRRLGRGGMGEVYVADDLRLGRQVAIKVLRAEIGRSKEARKRFEREARATAKIVSEHVVTIFDLGVGPDEHPYLVMEYLEGRTLRSLLDAEGPLAAPRAVRIIRGVCWGLEAAHARGVIHRDLKPENLLLARRDDGLEACKVLDFGLAKLPTVAASEAATREGVPLGTLHYMSPEQARGDADIDERTDVYGCAAVMYEMLSGKRPHSADSHHALLYKIVHEAPQRIEELCPFLPSGLADAIRSGLQNDRRLRPATMSAFRGAIEPFLTHHADRPGLEPLATLPTGQDTVSNESHLRAQASPRRSTMLWASSAFAASLLTLALAIRLTQSWPNTRPRTLSHLRPLSSMIATVERRTEQRLAAAGGVPSVVRDSVAAAQAPSAFQPRTAPPQPRPSGKVVEPSAENKLFERQNPYD
jgi:serine/threonine protein kinase